ncbi:hypothetical protein [Proteus sp. CD3]|uniref:hypothetical protein n=1 Tax=Proteus sp. CD3 TaxID=1921565 RepID=UPI00124AA9C4|nr:hypothetical protein [Proteus sp. CD3]QEZ93251.1 hypothetical protein BTA34_13300 [Proteus sp. CD3]
MEVYFNKLANVLPANDKRENVAFLLSEKIANCSNSLPNDSFFILKHKMSNVYVDNNFLAEIKSELTDVINEYIKDDPHHLDKINKANNKFGSDCLDRENINYLTAINLNSLDTIQNFIDTIISKTDSSSLKDKIFNKDNNPAINLFFEKNLLCKFNKKSISKLIEEMKNKTIELNPGCNLPFIVDKKKYIFVKLGNVEAANNQVKLENKVKIESKDDNNIKICFNKDNNPLNKEKIKSELTKFEISFNFLNENINKLYNVINKYYKYASLSNANNTFNFIKDDGSLEDFYKIINEKDDGGYIRERLNNYSKFNEAHRTLNVFYQDYINLFREEKLEKIEINKLLEMTRKVESNTDSLAIELKSLESFSNAYNDYEKKIKNKVSNIAIKNSSCSSINEITTKTNECLSLLDECIKRKEIGFFSKVYKLFFPKRHNESVSLLIDYKSEINKISSYLELYKEEVNKYFIIGDICLMVTSKLSKINYPESLLGYLYGEKSKWDNFKQSLFKKDE